LAFLEERKSKLCENCRRRMERNPLRVLDCKEKSCIEITAKAPSILDFLCNECRAHFAELRRYLEAVGLRYQLNPRMVRGLDYYCRTAFEWTSTQLGAQNAVAAGGRYDGLVKELGGPATPGVGFALGMERLVSLLRAKVAHRSPGPVLYVAWIGQAARDWAFPAVHALRQRGLTVELDGEQRSLKSQMKRADKLRARYVIILGDDELQKGKGTLRNMDSKEQTEVNLERIAEDLPKRLGATNVEAGETYDEARVAAGTDHQGR
jgi:histidyl-tRNA synthetase